MTGTIIQPAMFTKAPYEELDYTADYERELRRVDDTIASSYWTVPSRDVDDSGNTWITLADGVTVVYQGTPSPNYQLGGTWKTPYKGVIMLKGGTLGKVYRVQNNIVTAGNRRYARQMLLTIAYR